MKDMLEMIGTPPCDACPYYAHCKARELACMDFLGYVANSFAYRRNRRQGAFTSKHKRQREPTRALFLRAFNV